MAISRSASPPMSPPFRARRKSFARRCERYCCNTLTYFPLLFVYGLSTWAVWVEASIGLLPVKGVWTGYISSAVGILLYILLNWSYTVAVFTSPGSPLDTDHGYSSLPNHAIPHYTSFTVKSTGDIRYCKKCHTRKPDRAHHCSTCGRCVLKMDHHCPWLATCVGLRNYKAFLLFLIYTSIFCWICLAVSATWVWSEILSDGKYIENLMPVNYILLAVISGIMGLVLTCFTLWHIMLACKGRTTIESLEKTRYLSPIKEGMQQQFQQRNYVDDTRAPDYTQQLAEIHANALPGVTRPEEGDSSSLPSRLQSPSSSPAQRSLSQNLRNRPYSGSTYADEERDREYDRYEDYLDELDSEKLPNAFDLGWRRNLLHVLGEKPSLWCLPICNTTGDGWTWEPSPKWLAAREEVAGERSAREDGARGGNYDGRMGASNGKVEAYHSQYGNGAPHVPCHSSISMQPLDRRRQVRADPEPDYDTDSDEEQPSEARRPLQQRRSPRPPFNLPPRTSSNAKNWNDLPDDMLAAPKRGGIQRTRSMEPSRPTRSRKDGWADWRPG